MRFYRVQQKQISFEDMIQFTSADGGDGYSEGLAVSGSPDGMDGGSRFGGAWDAMNQDDELVILEGTILYEIYDGYRIEPTKEIERFTIAQWESMLEDESAYDYE